MGSNLYDLNKCKSQNFLRKDGCNHFKSTQQEFTSHKISFSPYLLAFILSKTFSLQSKVFCLLGRCTQRDAHTSNNTRISRI